MVFSHFSIKDFPYLIFFYRILVAQTMLNPMDNWNSNFNVSKTRVSGELLVHARKINQKRLEIFCSTAKYNKGTFIQSPLVQTTAPSNAKRIEINFLKRTKIFYEISLLALEC